MECNQICKWNSNVGCVKPYGVPCILENVSPTDQKATNADRIRAMSDEELADWLGRTIADTVWDELGKRGVSFSRKAGLDACTQLLEWLKQPVKEKLP